MSSAYPGLNLLEAMIRFTLAEEIPLDPRLMIDLYQGLKERFPDLRDDQPWAVPGGNFGLRFGPARMESFLLSEPRGRFVHFQRDMIAIGWRAIDDLDASGYPGYDAAVVDGAAVIVEVLGRLLGDTAVRVTNMSYASELPAGVDSLDYLPIVRTGLTEVGTLREASVVFEGVDGMSLRYAFAPSLSGATRMESAAGIIHPSMSLEEALRDPGEQVHQRLKKLFELNVTQTARDAWE